MDKEDFGQSVSAPVAFGGWSPTLSGILPDAPPPALLEPPAVLFEFDYAALRHHRMWHEGVRSLVGN